MARGQPPPHNGGPQPGAGRSTQVIQREVAGDPHHTPTTTTQTPAASPNQKRRGRIRGPQPGVARNTHHHRQRNPARSGGESHTETSARSGEGPTTAHTSHTPTNTPHHTKPHATHTHTHTHARGRHAHTRTTANTDPTNTHHKHQHTHHRHTPRHKHTQHGKPPPAKTPTAAAGGPQPGVARYRPRDPQPGVAGAHPPPPPADPPARSGGELRPGPAARSGK